MKKTMLRTVAVLAAMLTVPAMADENANLVINGEIEITVRAPAAAHLENLDEVFSGWLYRADETQVVQMDDFDNPGMIWVDAAAEKWAAVDGSEGKSCADCHGDPESVAGVKAV